MALVKCVDCGHMVSDQAATCPVCGKLPRNGGGTGTQTEGKPKNPILSWPTRTLLGVVLGVVFFVIVFRWVGSGQAGSAARRALRGPEVVCDEELVVEANGAQMRGLTLPSARPLLVEATALKNADKGFNVYVMEMKDWEAFSQGARFRYFMALSAPKVTRFRRVATLPEGSYAVVVQNSENFLKAMAVRLKVVADPAE